LNNKEKKKSKKKLIDKQKFRQKLKITSSFLETFTDFNASRWRMVWQMFDKNDMKICVGKRLLNINLERELKAKEVIIRRKVVNMMYKQSRLLQT
jgi:hypothetical protein